MKTKILTAAIAAMFLSSCSDTLTLDKAENSKQVNFKTGINSTKGADNTISTLESSTAGIGLFVYRGTDGVAGSTNNDPVLLVNNKLIFETPNWVIRNGSNAVVNLFWPDNGDKLSFYSYFPKDAAGLTIVSPTAVGQTAKMSFNFTVQADPAAQVDLLVANWINPTSQANSAVALNYNHALTKIAFAGKTDVDSWKIIIKSIVLNNIKNSATYTIPTKGSLTQTERNATWTGHTGTASYTLPLISPAEFGKTSTTVTDPANGVFLLPQDLDAGATLVVTYDVYNTSANSYVSTNAVKTFEIGKVSGNTSGDLSTTWNRGALITYHYTFQKPSTGVGSQVEFTVQVNGWNTEDFDLN